MQGTAEYFDGLRKIKTPQTMPDSNLLLVLPSVWELSFHDFYHLYVKQEAIGRNYALISGPDGLLICRNVYHDMDDAKKRCYGLVRQHLESWDTELIKLITGR